jgi:hypothetical protein
VPDAAVAGGRDVPVRFSGTGRKTAGPFFDVRMMAAGTGVAL